MRGTPREVYALLRDWHAASEDPGPLMVETSGSTGEPKRVLLSRSAMRASADATHGRLGGAGQWLLDLPATYVAGVQVLFRSVLAGEEPVVRGEHESFSAATGAMTGARRYVSLVPTQLNRMLASPPDTEALREFDAVLVGGAALDRRLRREAADAGVAVVATYGMSETCGGCVYDGLTLDRVAVAIDAEGRIRIGGPVLFEGYDGEPGLTAEVKQGEWFLTSDLGRIDEDGRLQVLGRMDDVVISGGVNVPAAAVAARLRQHPRIHQAEVIGVPDPEWGQRVVAVVVSQPGVATRNVPPLDDLRNWVAQVHPRAWAPRQLIRAREIPLLPNGKIDRLTLERVATGETPV
ncbi:MAG: AMP-binding protein [Nocardioidaceae bacterium]